MKKRRHYIPGYAAIIASVFLVSFGGSLVTEANMDWYDTLALPMLAPPGWVIGLAWSFIFLCTGASALLIFIHAKKYERTKLMLLFGINGSLNVLWTVIFFGLHQVGWALLEIFALQISTLWIALYAWPISKKAALLLLPYLVWVPFAGYLTWRILTLNS